MIHSIKQLQMEKRRIEHASKMLEDKLAEDWSELKSSVMPGNLVREAIEKFSVKKEKNQGKLKNILETAAGFTIDILTNRLAGKVEK